MTGPQLAKADGVANVTFDVATAKSYPGANYDLVTFFDCLHDMGDPVGASAHVRETLNANGAWLIVEPNAQDDLAGNLNPVGRIYFGDYPHVKLIQRRGAERAPA